MADTKQKYAILLDTLMRRMESGSLHWDTTSSAEVFSTDIGGHVVHLGRDWDSDPPHFVRTFGSNGELADYITGESVSPIKPFDHRYATYNALMAEMYRRAGRQVSGAEQILDSLIQHLGVKTKEVEVRGTEDELPF